MAKKRITYFNTVKWFIFPCSLLPILFNMLTLLAQTSINSAYRRDTYFIRLDFQKANLSEIIHFTDNSQEGIHFLENIPLNEDIRRSYSFALLGYCHGYLTDLDVKGEKYHVQGCTTPSIYNGFPLEKEIKNVFDTYILPKFPTAVLEFPKEVRDKFDSYNIRYKTMAGLSVAAIFFSSLSSVTYILSLFLISHTFIIGVISSVLSAVFLLCNAIINIVVNTQIQSTFEGIRESFETDYGDLIFVFNWLAFAFQSLVVVLLLSMWSIRMRTFKKGVKVSINDSSGTKTKTDDSKNETPVKFKFTDTLNTSNTVTMKL